MYTINISLPKQLYQKVDTIIKEEGFASRSEFFRTLIRVYSVLKGKNLELMEFSPRPLSEIEMEMEKTGKYNSDFIKSVVSGLKKSSLYADKPVKK